MAIYTQADVCRGLGKHPQHFAQLPKLPEPDAVGVPRKDGTGARRYWQEATVAAWAATNGLRFDPIRARRG